MKQKYYLINSFALKKNYINKFSHKLLPKMPGIPQSSKEKGKYFRKNLKQKNSKDRFWHITFLKIMLGTNPFPSAKVDWVAVKSKATSHRGSNYKYTLIMYLNLKAKLNSKCGHGTLKIMDGHDLCSSAAMFLSEVAKRSPRTYFGLQEGWKKISHIKKRRQIQKKENCQEPALEQFSKWCHTFRDYTTLFDL